MEPIDLFSPAALEDPYPVYERLRRDAPVHRLPQTGIWLVSRHSDLVEAAARPDVFSSHISAVIYAGQGTDPAFIPADPDAIGAVDVLATQDPPAHSVQRKLVAGAFTPPKMRALEPMISAFAEAELARTNDVEWMEAVANPLPVAVISTILGLPASDAADVKRWADAGVDLLSGVAPPERMVEAWQEMVGFLDFLRRRLESPSPGSVTADLAAAVDAGTLDEREAVSLLLQLVIAGSESTTSLIGTAARALAERPALQSALREDPARVPAFLEEALRLESPFRGHFRVTTKATTLGGVDLPEGARVMLMWGAANRDASAFADPDALDLDRDHPTSHVAFGSGIHFCIGAPLARIESRVVIETLLRRTSSFTLAAEPSHVPSIFVRRLARLPLRLRR